MGRTLGSRARLLFASLMVVIAAIFATSAAAEAAPYGQSGIWVGVSTNSPLPGQNILVAVHDATSDSTLLVYANVASGRLLLGYLLVNAQGVAYGYYAWPLGLSGSGTLSVEPKASSSAASGSAASSAASVSKATASVPITTKTTTTLTTTTTTTSAKAISANTAAAKLASLGSLGTVKSAAVAALADSVVTPDTASSAIDGLSFKSDNRTLQSAGFKSGYTDGAIIGVGLIALFLLGGGAAYQLVGGRRR